MCTNVVLFLWDTRIGKNLVYVTFRVERVFPDVPEFVIIFQWSIIFNTSYRRNRRDTYVSSRDTTVEAVRSHPTASSQYNTIVNKIMMVMLAVTELDEMMPIMEVKNAVKCGAVAFYLPKP